MNSNVNLNAEMIDINSPQRKTHIVDVYNERDNDNKHKNEGAYFLLY